MVRYSAQTANELKSLLHKNVLNGLTAAALFLIVATSCKKSKNGGAMTSLRMFIFHYDFILNSIGRVDKRH